MEDPLEDGDGGERGEDVDGRDEEVEADENEAGGEDDDAHHAVGDPDLALDPERLRPVELPVLRGDPARLRAVTGWTPEIPLADTLDELLAWWRERVAAGD